jgi:hypothetical protein
MEITANLTICLELNLVSTWLRLLLMKNKWIFEEFPNFIIINT